MKKLMNLWLMAALVCGLGLSVASCKDDDDNNSNGSESGTPEEQMAEQSNEFWAVVGQLVGTTNATDDYQSKTFEPIIGEAVAGNATVRRVLVNTMESAAERFESLVGLDEGTVTAETGSYTWTSDAVGTLTYTKSQDGQSLATVDVSIRQVPGLRQIVYMTPEQMGTNAGEDSWRNCYYHFGDVIKRTTREGITEYWMCVRPSFDPEGKKKSHWATVSPLPKENIATYESSHGHTYNVPTKLGQDDDQMENMAEMLYAMYNPVLWEQHIADNAGGIFSSGIDIFQDFSRKNIQYFSSDFWQRVQKGWQETKVGDKADLWELVFGKKQEEFNRCFDLYGIHLLYYGYKWKWSISNSLTLYEQVFTTKGSGTKSNMHNRQKRTISHDVVNKNDRRSDILVNLKAMYNEKVPYLTNNDLTSMNGSEKFFGSDADDMPHYIFRFATGEELAKQSGAAYDKRTKISGFEDVYVYTKKYGLDVNKGCETRDDIKNATTAGSLAAPKVGAIIGADGNFYEKKAQAEAQGGGAVAIVMALSDKAHPFENGTQYNGIGMFLPEKGNFVSAEMSGDYGYDCGLQKHDSFAEYLADLNGLAVTNQMVNGCNKDHVHPLAVQVRNYQKKLTEQGMQRHHFSPWFIPSFGQWLRALEGFGFVLPTEDKNGDYKDGQAKVNEIFEAAGLNGGGSAIGGLRTMTCSVSPFSEPTFERFLRGEWGSITFESIDNVVNKNKTALHGDATSNDIAYPFILFEY